MPRRLQPVWLLLVLALSQTGCGLLRPLRALPPIPDVPQSNALIFVADGAGDFRGASNALSHAVRDSGLPLTIEPFVWSHGYGRILSDQIDETHSRREGYRLAELVTLAKRLRPDRPIHLIGHSAGSLVVLSAAEQAPAGTINQIALLAPAVPETYDLRPALSHVSGLIHVYYSHRDCLYLKVGTALNSLVHLRFIPASGMHGFRPMLRSQRDAEYYSRLRQYPWDPKLQWTGHEGGHYGAYQQTYLKLFVLPNLCPGPVTCVPRAESD